MSGQTLDSLEYAKRLYVRRAGAVALKEQRYKAVDGWEPDPKKCHDNVARIVAENPGYSAVHGWLVSDLAAHFSFIAHSVVRSPEGELVNITPRAVALPWNYPFLVDDDPSYWQIADSAPNRSIMCEAEGRSREEIAARAKVMSQEDAAAPVPLDAILKLIGLR